VTEELNTTEINILSNLKENSGSEKNIYPLVLLELVVKDPDNEDLVEGLNSIIAKGLAKLDFELPFDDGQSINLYFLTTLKVSLTDKGFDMYDKLKTIK
jgi:hypothetical protein